MAYLHSLITIIYVVAYLILGIVWMPVVLIAGLFSKDQKERLSAGYIYVGLRILQVIAGCRVKVEGLENIPKDQAVLFVGNHRSIFDIVCAMPCMGWKLGIVAKKELKKVPLLNFWMTQMCTLFLDRNDLKAGVQMITDAQKLIQSGRSVLIYPEGTRHHKEGTLLPFHGGSFKIAIRTGCPIIPVTTVGTGDVFEDHFPKLKCKTVHVIFGTPIPTQGMPIPERKVLHEKVRDIIADTYAKYAPMDKEERHEQ